MKSGMTYEQAFFRSDEQAEAREAALKRGAFVYDVIDRRSKKPKPRMFIVGDANLRQFERSGMMKRMWVCRLVWCPGC